MAKGINKGNGQPPAAADKVVVRSVELPLAPTNDTAYRAQHVDVHSLSPPQALALHRMRDGLMRGGAMLANGRPVASNADAVRYVLEQLAG